MAENYDFLRTFTIDGKQTNHLFQIAKVTIPFLNKENDFYKVGNTDGAHFRGTRLDNYTLQIDGFVIRDNTNMSVSDAMDELKRLCNTEEPKPLVFDVLPDRYFNAVFSGAQEYDATDLDYTPLTLVFEVPDGLAHQINPSGFSNVYTSGTNLMLDSEFNNTKKYMASWVQLLDEKFDGSNIVRADFSNGTPLDEEERNDHWLYKTWVSNRTLPTLVKGTKVGISIYVRVNSIDPNNVYSGSLVLEEFTNGKKNNTNHFIRFANVVNEEFVKYEGVFTLENEKTDGVAMSLGIYGTGASLDYSKPMLAITTTDVVPSYVASEEGYGDVVNVVNNGTYKAYPTFNFTMNGENGLVAVLNDKGNVLQFGNPEDVDGTIATRMEMGVNQTFWGNTLPTDIVVNTNFDSVYKNMNSNPETPNLVQGSFSMTLDPDAITPVFQGVGDIGVWHGPTFLLPITAPSTNDRTQNFGTHIRFGFENYDKEQRGRIEYAINDENGSNAMTFIVRDSSRTANEIVLEMWYKHNRLEMVSLDRRQFKNSFFEASMERRGSQLIWRLAQIKSLNQYDNVVIDKQYRFVWNLEEDDTTKFTTVGAWMMRYSNTYHVLMKVTDLKCKWYDTPYYTDIKNYFQDGDLVTIDVASRALLINGVENTELNIVGNQWESFRVDLGTSTFQPIVSSWANKPSVNVELRQTYL